MEIKEIKLRNCKKFDVPYWYYASDKGLTDFTDTFFKELICFDDPYEIAFQGSWGQITGSVMHFDVSRCDRNET